MTKGNLKDSEIRELVRVTKGLTRDEAEIVANNLPLDILWNAVGNQIADMADFIDGFDKLAERKKS